VSKRGVTLPKAKKSLGQHFLKDQQVVEHLISLLAPPPTATIVEVGPGPGILTKALAACCQHLHAVELDQDMITYLKANLSLENLTLHAGDILKTDLNQFLRTGEDKLFIASNLPYQISSPFLFHLVEYMSIIDRIALMLQKEVIDRITAEPGSSDYGRLSVMMQYYFRTKSDLVISPSAFSPPPKVNSALVLLEPRTLSDEALLLAPTLSSVVKLAFGRRRKTIRNTLKPAFDANTIQALGIDPGARPQNLTLEQYLTLAKALTKTGFFASN